MRYIRITTPLGQIAEFIADHIRSEMDRRSYLAANELKNASLLVLRGQRSGRRYRVPGTYATQKDKASGKVRKGRYYTASAPGEPPAVRTGTFRNSWQPGVDRTGDVFVSKIESGATTDNGKYILGELLENGTSKMAPRPHHDRILEKAGPRIYRIYNQNYFSD